MVVTPHATPSTHRPSLSTRGDDCALRAPRVRQHLLLEPQLYTHDSHHPRRIQRNCTKTYFIIVIIFSRGILICPQPIIRVHAQSRLRLEIGSWYFPQYQAFALPSTGTRVPNGASGIRGRSLVEALGAVKHSRHFAIATGFFLSPDCVCPVLDRVHSLRRS